MRNIQTFTKWLMGAALASAFVLAAPHKAQAQVSFGIVAGAPQPYGYYGSAGYDRWRNHEYWERRRIEAERAAAWRHEHWEHERWHDRDGWRDRRYYR